MSYEGRVGIEARYFPPESKPWGYGVSIVRLATDSILTACSPLEEVRAEYPAMEIRKTGADDLKRWPGVVQLAQRELRPSFNALHYLKKTATLRTLVEKVPSMDERLPVVMTEVDTMPDRRTGGTFVMLVPEKGTDETTDLENEHEDMLDILEELADQGPLEWGDRQLDTTVAYIPPEVPEDAIHKTKKIIMPLFPLHVVLFEAQF